VFSGQQTLTKCPTRKSEASESRRREDTRSLARNGASLRQPLIVSCYIIIILTAIGLMPGGSVTKIGHT
jgi:hypothetical protein